MSESELAMLDWTRLVSFLKGTIKGKRKVSAVFS